MALPLPIRLPLSSNPLISDSLALLSECLPSPFPLLDAIDRSIPMPIKQLVAEAPLNRVFAEAIADGDFDDFEGRSIRLEVKGGQPGILFGFWCGMLRVLSGPGGSTICGSLSAFKTLS